ncbi:MAG TPA: hypothetical protein VFL66_02005 [Gaiellaceae bacterium]|nr:hypothetical protein [Gaiellaceae bacterium]
MRRTAAAVAAVAAAAAVAALAGCGGGSSTAGPSITVGAARVYRLAGFRPAGAVRAGKPTTVSFTIMQPDGKPLTAYKHGAGPHNGVHLILVRSDLSAIIHRHPPVAASGRISQRVVFPEPGRYRVVIDAYPKTSGPQPSFQLFGWVDVAGAAKTKPLPRFTPSETVDGYRFVLHGGEPHLQAIEPALLHFTVTAPDGKPAKFVPWYGALAHAIFFRRGSLDYFHTHICAPGASGCASVLGGSRITGRSSTPGKLSVGVLVPVPGTWRLFLQCQVGGHVVTAPFTLVVH